ncbi:energy transducer TonB [Sulfitobacter geojensis]|uniref:energy transducer TonB n=1 Tax=Sulfitobacter geojensis TaxID=1342299 RepID=UPI0036DE6BBA
MHTGQYISGAGHLGLIAWLLLGGLFADKPEPFEMTEVSVISGADFEAMMAAQQAPQSTTEVAQPATPEASTDVPEVSTAPDTAIEQPAPVQVETPPEDTPPQTDELPAEAPVEEPPQDPAEPVGDIAVLAPQTAPEAAPRPVERVAPEPVAQPEPEAQPDTETREAVAPDAAGEAPEQEAQEAAAPEEAVAEIVTEATSAPAASTRPPGRRPAAPAPQVAEAPAVETPAPTPAPEAQSTDSGSVTNDDVLAALAAAQEAVPAPSGPPLSAGEKDALRAQIAKCWNIGSLSTEALGTTVVIGVKMNSDATPVNDSIRMISASGGSDASARRVYDSARRAIILCGSRGYELPADKYSQWQNIEMTFDPSKMGF